MSGDQLDPREVLDEARALVAKLERSLLEPDELDRLIDEEAAAIEELFDREREERLRNLQGDMQ